MSDDPTPSAPASISFRTSSRIWSSCSGVGGLSSRPTTYSRIVVAPTYDATFCATPRLSSSFRYSASVVQVMSYLRSPWALRRRCFISSVSGPIESPSPMIWVVTPCRISPCDRPSTSSVSVDHESMLMNPGATVRFVASTIVGAVAAERSRTAAI